MSASKNSGLNTERSVADVPVIHTITPSSLESVIIAPVACQKRASNGAACMQMRLGSSSSGML